MAWLYGIPPALLLACAIVAAIAIAAGGQTFVHRRFKQADFVTHNEVGGFMIAVVATLFSVVLGFLTATVWQQFADTRERVALESTAAADAWHMAIGLPGAVRQRVRRDVLSYAKVMVRDEWPEMKRGNFTPRADLIVMDAIAAAGTFVPKDSRESNSQTATLAQLGILHDDRQRRIAANEEGVTWFEWLVLFIGAACVITFCWIFGLRNARAHVMMTSAVATIIALTLVLLFELQYPFRSGIGIGPTAWSGVVAHIGMMQSGGQPDMRM